MQLYWLAVMLSGLVLIVGAWTGKIAMGIGWKLMAALSVISVVVLALRG